MKKMLFSIHFILPPSSFILSLPPSSFQMLRTRSDWMINRFRATHQRVSTLKPLDLQQASAQNSGHSGDSETNNLARQKINLRRELLRRSGGFKLGLRPDRLKLVDEQRAVACQRSGGARSFPTDFRKTER